MKKTTTEEDVEWIMKPFLVDSVDDDDIHLDERWAPKTNEIQEEDQEEKEDFAV